MNITFANIQEFFADLSTVARRAGEERLERPIVRASVESIECAEMMNEVSVRAGFHDDRYFYEALIPCGKDRLLPSRTKDDGMQEALRLIEEIRGVCSDLGVECRGGAWQRP